MKVVEFDGFHRDGGGCSEDGFLGGGARDLCCGAREAADDLAVCLGPRHVLEEFERDVGGIEVGENEDIGGRAAAGAGKFDLGGGGVQGHIGLEFAFDLDVVEIAQDFAAGEFGSGGHAAGIRSRCAAEGGVTEERDDGGAA